MCGIAGILSFGPPVAAEEATRMAGVLSHRGPDGEGAWSDGVCALGHRRLAIIDLSEAGRQPMSDAGESIWITFNGEIYNFQSLRAELESLGYRFRSRTDTEVIVHAYDRWGTDCVSRLRGMFAFAIWDRRRRRLFVARDRLGKKPLVYARLADRFLFASELQALVADRSVPREVDAEAIDQYLSWGYVPAPRTAYRGVAKLPPAHWLTVDLASGTPEMRVERYWRLDYEPKAELSEMDAIEALREKLAEAVRLRLVSDVPVGAFLSGGIDSSVIVGLMAKASDRPVRTFSIGFEEASYNELGHARRIAERWSTDHREFVVQPDALAILPALVRHYGEPYADSSAVPTFYVSKMTRESVTVALNGDGGDESFAGYERYLANRLAAHVRRVPGGGASARALAAMLPGSIDFRNRAQRVKRFLAAAGQPMESAYGLWVGYFGEEAKGALYSRDFHARLNGSRPTAWLGALFARAKGLDPVEAAMAVDVESYLPYDLLAKVDITSMLNSLEARSPLLDHEVMEFAARLPVGLKLAGRTSKYLVKRAFPDLLPPENVNRPKMGFGVPVGAWFRGPLQALLEDALLSEGAARRGYFEPAELRRLVAEHAARAADHGPLLWSLLMLELWHREFVD